MGETGKRPFQFSFNGELTASYQREAALVRGRAVESPLHLKPASNLRLQTA